MNPDYRRLLPKMITFVVNGLGFLFFFWIRPKKIDRAKVKKIVIMKFDQIGDTFLATPTFEAIGRLFRDAQISAFVAPWNQGVLVGNPYLKTIHLCSAVPNIQRDSRLSLFNPSQVKYLTAEIRRQQPDMVVDLQGNPLSVLASFFANVPVRVGFMRKLLSFLLNVRVSYPSTLHQSDVLFCIAQALGYEEEKPQPRIFLNGTVNEQIRQLIKNRGLGEFIVFHLGAGLSYKQWPMENFASLARRARGQRPSLQIAVIGGGEDMPLVGRLLERTKTGIVSFVGVFDIRETYAFLSHARGFVGNDSGPAHLAGALGIPTVVLMNEWVGVDRWKALGEKVHIMTGKKRHRCPGVSCREIPCPNMAAISVEEVFEIVKDF